MKKLNEVVYKKLYAQAEEAKEQGKVKLANDIFEAIGPFANDETSDYTYNQLQEDVHRDLWKAATRLLHYYDVDSVDAEKINAEITHWASKLVDGLETTLQVDGVVGGPFEPKVPGQE